MYTDELCVLVADDSELLCAVLSHHLRQMGFVHIEETEDGCLALARALRYKPDVIITDYRMPVMDGREFVSRLRQWPDLKDVPVIVATTEDWNAAVWEDYGFSAYLHKPFTQKELWARLTDVLPSLRQRRAKAELEGRGQDEVS